MKKTWLADDGETWLIDPDDILADTANARLAGCAPELLSALKEMVDHSYVGDSMRLDLARSYAKKVIKKVEG